MTQAFDDREQAAASQVPVGTPGPGVRIVDMLDRPNRNASCLPARGVVVSGLRQPK